MTSATDTRFGWIAACFFLIPFTYAIQVIFENQYLGVIPYLTLVPIAIRVFNTLNRRKYLIVDGIRRDFTISTPVLTLFVLSLAHIFIDYVQGGIVELQAIRLVIIYIFVVVIFFYFAIDDRLDEINGVLCAIGVASLIIGIQWAYSSYYKLVEGDPGWFAKASYEYIKHVNGYSSADVNVSILRAEYRSYGLLDKHTTTGAIVALGGLAAISWLTPKNNIIYAFLASSLFFIFLSVGMATTAWIAYVAIAPLVICLAYRRGIVMYLSVVMKYIIIIIMGSLAMSYFNKSENLRQHISVLAGNQIQYIMNLDAARSVSDSSYISFVGIYYRYLMAYISHIKNNPMTFIWGEGLPNGSAAQFSRGGDFALIELLVTYGFPASLLLFMAISFSLSRAIFVARDKNTPNENRAVVAFAVGATLFLVISLAHYNTIFNKAVFILLPFLLSLFYRYGRGNQ